MLGEQRLVDAQRILLMPLLQVQLRHRFRQHRLRLRQRRGIRRTIVIGQGHGGRNARRWTGPGGGGGGGRWWCWRCWRPSRTDLVVRHDERQIDLGQRLVEIGRRPPPPPRPPPPRHPTPHPPLPRPPPRPPPS